MDHEWRFNEEDAWDEEDDLARAQDDGPPDDALAGKDEDGVVTVYVTDEGKVLSAELLANWKKSVAPHELGQRIVTAANAATMEAAAKQAELVQPEQAGGQGLAPKQDAPAQRGADQGDAPSLAVDDVMRLIDNVSADLERFSQRMAEVTNQTVSVDSAGGHVTAKGQQGQVLEISLDNGWASRSRKAEVENEIVDVLRTLHSRSAPAEVTQGPQSDSISQLMSLAGDPQSLLRRLGLTK